MKFAGDKALKADVAKLDDSKVPDDITEINNVSYIDDDLPGHMLDVYLHKDGTKSQSSSIYTAADLYLKIRR